MTTEEGQEKVAVKLIFEKIVNTSERFLGKNAGTNKQELYCAANSFSLKIYIVYFLSPSWHVPIFLLSITAISKFVNLH
jgi:hypothetical protein